MLELSIILFPDSPMDILRQECWKRIDYAYREAERLAALRADWELLALTFWGLQTNWSTAAILAADVLLNQWRKS
jgi:hypothetical protein